MSQNEEKINQFIDALCEMDPQYVEEARQAFSSKSIEKHIFSGSGFSSFLRRWFHSPSVRIAAAACLLLVIALGVRKAHIFPDILFFQETENSSSSSFQSSADNSDPENPLPEQQVVEQTSEQAEKAIDEETVFSGLKGTEEDAAQERMELENGSLSTEPPALTIYTSPETSQPDSTTKESADVPYILSSAYSWFHDKDNDSSSSNDSRGIDEWNPANLTVLFLTPNSTITPDFNGIEPDSYTIRCIPASEVQKIDSEKNYLDIEAEEDGSFRLPEEEDSYIVEIHAVWDNNTYEGNCIYRFQVNFQE